MQINKMKKFNLFCLSTGLLLFAVAAAWAQKPASVREHNAPDSQVYWKDLPSHPRLFADDARIASIKTQKDTVSVQLLWLLKTTGENLLSAPKIDYPRGISNFGTSRSVQGRILALALAYRLFGDDRYLAKAKDELLQLAAVNDWGVGHFLDVGEASLAAGIGYDWLYNKLTAEERKTVAGAIKTKALLPGLASKEGEGSWVNGNFNWNPVCHGGLLVGALAVAEEEPQLARQIVERGIKNIPVAGDAYTPDGSFAEGPSYWSYGTSFYVIAVEALRSARGTSYGLEKIPGFLKTGDYHNHMAGATGEEYNYSDYHIENQNQPVMFWFARELMRPDLINDELVSVARLYEAGQSGSLQTQDKKLVQSRHTPLAILWWDASLLAQKQNTTAPLQWTAGGLMPVSVMRSGWNDANATFAALKGGTPNNSHGHMDAGSFILEAGGVRWALDLGTESYDKMRAARLDLWNYTQNSNRWTTFRVGPEGHNILRFDGERQLINGRGEVTGLKTANGVMGAEADLSSLYMNKAGRVTRRLLLYPDRSVSIQDSWKANDSAVTVSFQWLTRATVAKDADGLLLQQAGQLLRLKLEQPQPATGVVIEVQDVSQSKAVQDSDNPGLSRIVITVKTPAGGNGQLFVHAYLIKSTAERKPTPNP